MGLISRPAKQGGFFSYVEKVAASFTKILASEADDDFDTIYEGFNGNINNDNIIAGAGIERSKLNLGELEEADLADGSVTTDKIADGAVTTPKIADGAVTHAKLAADAKTVNFSTPFTAQSLAAPQAEATLATLNITSTAGKQTRMTVDWAAVLSVTSAGLGGVKVRIKADAVTIMQHDYGWGLAGNMPLPGMMVWAGFTAGAHALTVTIEVTRAAGNATFVILGSAPGVFYADEFA